MNALDRIYQRRLSLARRKAENTVMSITPSPAAVSDAATAVAWQQSKLISKRQEEAVQALKFHGMSWSMLEIGQP